jgi:hypothetical protein
MRLFQRKRQRWQKRIGDGERPPAQTSFREPRTLRNWARRLIGLTCKCVPATTPGAGKSMLAARPQVSNIAQSILSELDRVRGTRMKLTLDMDAETAVGFP